MNNDFPLYPTHADARCFSCGAALRGAIADSEFGRGNGEYKRACMACGMWTFYDLEEEAVDGNGYTYRTARGWTWVSRDASRSRGHYATPDEALAKGATDHAELGPFGQRTPAQLAQSLDARRRSDADTLYNLFVDDVAHGHACPRCFAQIGKAVKGDDGFMCLHCGAHWPDERPARQPTPCQQQQANAGAFTAAPHTPTPWAIDGEDVYDLAYRERIAKFNFNGREARSILPARANAIHVIRCVNAHDDLVRALRMALQVMSGNNMSKQGLVNALTAGRDALAKVEGSKS